MVKVCCGLPALSECFIHSTISQTVAVRCRCNCAICLMLARIYEQLHNGIYPSGGASEGTNHGSSPPPLTLLRRGCRAHMHCYSGRSQMVKSTDRVLAPSLQLL